MYFKESTFFKVCVCMLLLVFVGQPVVALAQSSDGSDYFEGKMAGEANAKATAIWFFAGFCGGLLGVIIAYVVKPSPSPAEYMGQSQAYINGYIEGYKSKSAKMQGGKAVAGCLLGTALSVLIQVMIAAGDDDI